MRLMRLIALSRGIHNLKISTIGVFEQHAANSLMLDFSEISLNEHFCSITIMLWRLSKQKHPRSATNVYQILEYLS